VVRFIGAFFGSVMISTAPGMVSDLVNDDQRALAMSIWSIGPVNGPGSYQSTLSCEFLSHS
jgi:MFS family permease